VILICRFVVEPAVAQDFLIRARRALALVTAVEAGKWGPRSSGTPMYL
jgi:hypothetical protein